MSDSNRKCASEPDKPFEKTVCGFAEHVGVEVCTALKDDIGNQTDDCKKIILDIAEGRIDGQTAKKVFVEKFGEDAYTKFREKVVQVVESVSR